MSVGSTTLLCGVCRTESSLFSNVALDAEAHRLITRNYATFSNSCKTPGCDHRFKPTNVFPEVYVSWGNTKAGKPRKRCRGCGTTVTDGHDHRTWKRIRVHTDIVKDLVNGASLRAICRKHDLHPETLYERLRFIQRQMVAFEMYRLAKLKSDPKFASRTWWLSTDSMDFMVNWVSRDRREAVQLSTITTADNLSQFILRADVTFNPLIHRAGLHFEDLLAAGDFDVPEGLGRSAAYDVRAFLRAAAFDLKLEAARLPDQDRRLKEIRDALFHIGRIYNRTSARLPYDTIGSPTTGVVTRRIYTATAHYAVLQWMLPAQARYVLMTDVDASLVTAMTIGMAPRIVDGHAEIALVACAKGLSVDKKRSLIGEYRKQLRDFAEMIAKTQPVRTGRELRREFVKAFATRREQSIAAIEAEWWQVPVQSMYEPEKTVGIVLQQPAKDEDARRDRSAELVDRASLHSVDTFFSFMRDRTAALQRAGLSRSTGWHYNKFQPYRGDMGQILIDIVRVWYNWCEPRAQAVDKELQNLEQILAFSMHEEIEAAVREEDREIRRKTPTTPAMRLGLAKSPIRLSHILYYDWLEKVWQPHRSKEQNPKAA